MDSLDSFLVRKVRAELERIIDEKTQSLVGAPAQDFPSYKTRVGDIEGLRTALVILNEAAKSILYDAHTG